MKCLFVDGFTKCCFTAVSVHRHRNSNSKLFAFPWESTFLHLSGVSRLSCRLSRSHVSTTVKAPYITFTHVIIATEFLSSFLHYEKLYFSLGNYCYNLNKPSSRRCYDCSKRHAETCMFLYVVRFLTPALSQDVVQITKGIVPCFTAACYVCALQPTHPSEQCNILSGMIINLATDAPLCIIDVATDAPSCIMYEIIM